LLPDVNPWGLRGTELCRLLYKASINRTPTSAVILPVRGKGIEQMLTVRATVLKCVFE
jgi:hypothetical protein